jgi:hypothetical protein
VNKGDKGGGDKDWDSVGDANGDKAGGQPKEKG